jgi:hypothetical protein
MKMKNANLLVIFLTILCIALTGCGPIYTVHQQIGNSSVDVDSTGQKAWWVDPSGDVQTNDLDRLRRETPFEIITPDYLPPELLNIPVMFSKEIGANAATEVTIKFDYIEAQKRVSIEEINYKYEQKPNENYKPVYFDVKGTNILEETLSQRSQKDGKDRIFDAYVFYWYRNGVSYTVNIIYYDEIEARKVIESMIK